MNKPCINGGRGVRVGQLPSGAFPASSKALRKYSQTGLNGVMTQVEGTEQPGQFHSSLPLITSQFRIGDSINVL